MFPLPLVIGTSFHVLCTFDLWIYKPSFSRVEMYRNRSEELYHSNQDYWCRKTHHHKRRSWDIRRNFIQNRSSLWHVVFVHYYTNYRNSSWGMFLFRLTDSLRQVLNLRKTPPKMYVRWIDGKNKKNIVKPTWSVHKVSLHKTSLGTITCYKEFKITHVLMVV